MLSVLDLHINALCGTINRETEQIHRAVGAVKEIGFVELSAPLPYHMFLKGRISEKCNPPAGSRGGR